MNSKPIRLKGHEVRAILDGSKTQHRLVIKPCKDLYIGCNLAPNEIAGEINGGHYENSKYKPGDQLWVQEKWARTKVYQDHTERDWIVYATGDNTTDYGGPWKPSTQMPRAASRITLEVTRVTAEKLRDISAAHAELEGVGLRRVSDNDFRYIDYSDKDGLRTFGDPRDSYWSLWESINGPGSWTENPWVWVVEFKRVNP